MVDEEMCNAAYDAIVDSSNEDLFTSNKSVAQAVINAAWRRFDPEDESTWPSEVREYLTVKYDRTKNPIHRQWWPDGGYGADYWGSITHYAHPARLMPGPINE